VLSYQLFIGKLVRAVVWAVIGSAATRCLLICSFVGKLLISF